MRRHDAAATPTNPNPFLNKRILVLSGGLDKLVPYDSGSEFIEALDVGPEGVKTVVVQPDAGHELTPKMVELLANFVWDNALARSARL